jgi:hypothetical protein
MREAGWRGMGRAALLAAAVVVCGGASGNGCELTSPTCENTGTCRQSFCSEGHGRYLATEDIVIDRDNGRRLWERGFGPAGIYAGAAARCASLTVEGIAGWRVPTSTELASIIFKPGGLGGGPDTCQPSIDQAAFRSPPGEGAGFWTSTVSVDGQTRYYGDFSDGRLKRDFDDDPTVFVRCLHDPVTR